MINWQCITEFNFTYAILGGAWLRDADGNCTWTSIDVIDKHMGKGWFTKMLGKQGFFTGCWIKVPA